MTYIGTVEERGVKRGLSIVVSWMFSLRNLSKSAQGFQREPFNFAVTAYPVSFECQLLWYRFILVTSVCLPNYIKETLKICVSPRISKYIFVGFCKRLRRVQDSAWWYKRHGKVVHCFPLRFDADPDPTSYFDAEPDPDPPLKLGQVNTGSWQILSVPM